MYDLIVLGGGAGGLNVAVAAAAVGAKVALVEKGETGGECTFTACVPSKALIRAARFVAEARRAAEFGIKLAPPEVDFAAVMARVRSVVAGFARSDSAEHLQGRGVEVIRGTAAFDAYDTVLVDGRTPLRGRAFVIATGSRPASPPIPGLDAVGALDHTTIWGLDALPPELLILGAGPVGIEFAQAFARLGSRVKVVADSAHILPREDPEVADRLQALLEAEGIRFHLGAEVYKASLRDGQPVLAYRREADAFPREVGGSHLLVATGRRANVEGLNLDAMGIHATAEHGVEVDEHLKTRAANVWAVGDVLGHDQFTHAAEREAAVVIQNALLARDLAPKRMEFATLPRVTFTDPELAAVGSGQPDGSRTFRVELAELDRARIDGRAEGLAKLVATPSGKLVGATILGPEAGELLPPFVLALERGLSLDDLGGLVFAYPTYSALGRLLANRFRATRLESGLVRTALRWIYGFKPRAGGDGEVGDSPQRHEEKSK
ncbi:MAG TPA: FAD-dependent oxidoreductase [Isosphaeraceae bacterium]|jgi:pyruvate/2-oxoglutarate dehydrogenase complex dihydrolipoamide dehydrogenase (E3) component|nr:FAD-dependent oxidoreductase [Isosphaeraceae bacterium]